MSGTERMRQAPPAAGMVFVAMDLATAEALVLFLAKRGVLWERHCADCCVGDAMELPRQLAGGYAAAFRRPGFKREKTEGTEGTEI